MATRKTELVPVSNNGNLELSGEGLSMYDKLNNFVKNSLIEGQHYGKVPGASKPSLFKGGAELINKEAQIIADFEIIADKVDFETPFFAYAFKCSLYREGMKVSEGYGACNSKERKYLSDRTDKFFLYNTIMKMAKKRSYVDATVTAWGLSGILTQDMEDLEASPVEEEKKEAPPAEDNFKHYRSTYFAQGVIKGMNEQQRHDWNYRYIHKSSTKEFTEYDWKKAIELARLQSTPMGFIDSETKEPIPEPEQAAYDYLAEKASVTKDLIEKFFDNALMEKPELNIQNELEKIFADNNGKEAKLIKKIKEFEQIPF
jgi:hypothetical protein